LFKDNDYLTTTTMPTKKDFIEYFEGFYVPTDFFEGFVCVKVLPDTEKYKKYKDKNVDVEVRKHLWWSETPIMSKMDFIRKMNLTFNKMIDIKMEENDNMEKILDTNKKFMFELLDIFEEIEDEEVIEQINPKMKDVIDRYMAS
jgi:uncharacterized Ntn-hydrolase superfamily protein